MRLVVGRVVVSFSPLRLSVAAARSPKIGDMRDIPEDQHNRLRCNVLQALARMLSCFLAISDGKLSQLQSTESSA